MSSHSRENRNAHDFTKETPDRNVLELVPISEIRPVPFSRRERLVMAGQLGDEASQEGLDEIDPSRPLDLADFADAPSVIDPEPVQSWPTVYDFDGYLPPEPESDIEELEELEPLDEVIEAADSADTEADESAIEEPHRDSYTAGREEDRIDFGSYFGPLPSRPLSAPPDRTSIPSGIEEFPLAAIPPAPPVPSDAASVAQLEADRLSELDTLVPPAAALLSTPPRARRSRGLLAFSAAAAIALGVGVVSYLSPTQQSAELDPVIEVASAPEITPVVVENPAFIEEAEAAEAAAVPTAQPDVIEAETGAVEVAATVPETTTPKGGSTHHRARETLSTSSNTTPPSIADALRRSAAPAPSAPTSGKAVEAGSEPPSSEPVTAAAEPAVELPAQPTREEVRTAIESTLAAARRCAPAYRGVVVPTDITIAPSGRVTLAQVGGSLAGTPEGSCIAKELRKARTSAFSGPRLQVSYPVGL